MASGIFTIDGKSYDVFIPKGGIRRSFKILDGPNAGRLLNAQMSRDIIGTFYNYRLDIARGGLNPAAYDELYEILSEPRDFHSVSLPYGQKTLSFEAYVTGGDDQLLRMGKSGRHWDALSIDIVAKEPFRRP